MHVTTLFMCLAALSTTGWAQYVLEDDYMQSGFFDMFTFFEGPDPTDGFVAYQSESDATSQDLISNSGGTVQLKVGTAQSTPDGRPSVRLTSNKSYQSGLVVVDVEHMPGGICGTWPAFWMVGPDWPTEGEIDIIEGVNAAQTNQMTLHTGPDCSIANTNEMVGIVSTSNCDVSDGDNTGCGITTTNTATFGTGFNEAGGGVYATEWTSSFIRIFFFPRGSEPSDIASGSPDPNSWGEPIASFSGECDIANSFKNQQIVFDTTFCGSWAGEVWSNSTCASKAATCNDYVANNGDAFTEAFWSINALQVFQSTGSTSNSSAPVPSFAPSSSQGFPGAQSTFSRSFVPTGPPSGVPSAPSGAPFSPPPAAPSAPSGAPFSPPPAEPSEAPSEPPAAAPSAPAPSTAPSSPAQVSSPPENSAPGGFQPSQTFGGFGGHGGGGGFGGGHGFVAQTIATESVQKRAIETGTAGVGHGIDENNVVLVDSLQHMRISRHLKQHKSRHGSRRL